MLRNVLLVTSAGRYPVRVAVAAYNCDDIPREHLYPALLALVLAGARIHLVDMEIRALHMPRPI